MHVIYIFYTVCIPKTFPFLCNDNFYFNRDCCVKILAKEFGGLDGPERKNQLRLRRQPLKRYSDCSRAVNRGKGEMSPHLRTTKQVL